MAAWSCYFRGKNAKNISSGFRTRELAPLRVQSFLGRSYSLETKMWTHVSCSDLGDCMDGHDHSNLWV